MAEEESKRVVAKPEEEKEEEPESGESSGEDMCDLGHKVVALEKSIAASEGKRKAEEAQLEIISKRMGRIEEIGRELGEEEKKLKRRKVELQDKISWNWNEIYDNDVEFGHQQKDEVEVKKKRDETMKKLEEQKAELRAVHREGLARAGGTSTTSFLRASIAKKTRELECPVCWIVAAPPILGCRRFHLLCSACASHLCAAALPASCPTCREAFEVGGPFRNRFAEREAEEVREMREQLETAT